MNEYDEFCKKIKIREGEGMVKPCVAYFKIGQDKGTM